MTVLWTRVLLSIGHAGDDWSAGAGNQFPLTARNSAGSTWYSIPEVNTAGGARPYQHASVWHGGFSWFDDPTIVYQLTVRATLNEYMSGHPDYPGEVVVISPFDFPNTPPGHPNAACFFRARVASEPAGDSLIEWEYGTEQQVATAVWGPLDVAFDQDTRLQFQYQANNVSPYHWTIWSAGLTVSKVGF